MKIYEFLDSPDKWCGGAMARNSRGEPCNMNSSEACKWCLIGALNVCYKGATRNKLGTKLDIAARKRRPGVGSAVEFNDRFGYDAVIDLARELDI